MYVISERFFSSYANKNVMHEIDKYIINIVCRMWKNKYIFKISML